MIIGIYAPFDSTVGGSFHYYISLIKLLIANNEIKKIVIYTQYPQFYTIKNNKIQVVQLELKNLQLFSISNIFLKITWKFHNFFKFLNFIIPDYLYIHSRPSQFKNVPNIKIDYIISTIPTIDKFILKYKNIAIIHDLYFLPKYYGRIKKRDIDREILTRYSAKNFKYILCDSPLGKNQLINEYKIKNNKIVLLPTGPSESALNDIQEEIVGFDLPNNFIFYPGHIGEDKNQKCLIYAIEHLIKKGHDIKCILTVPSFSLVDNSFFINEIERLSLNDQIIILPNVSNSIINYLYKKALCLCFSSYIGPTNMPIWEAMVLNCPVIASNIGAHNWQLGSDVSLFNPDNPEELSNLILRIINDKNFKDNLIETSKKRLVELNIIDRSIYIDSLISKLKITN